MATTPIQFDLLANAMDSVSYAVELLAWPDIQNDERRMKQGVISDSVQMTRLGCEGKPVAS